MKNFRKIKKALILTLFVTVGFCFVFINDAHALPRVLRYGVKSISGPDSDNKYNIKVSWTTEDTAYKKISYGASNSNPPTITTTDQSTDSQATYFEHLIPTSLSLGDTYYIQPNALVYSSGTPYTSLNYPSQFPVVVGAPYLQSIDTTTLNCDGNVKCYCDSGTGTCRFGVDSNIIIKATFSETLKASPSPGMVVSLNNNSGSAGPNITLDQLSGNTLSKTYTVVAGQNTDDLTILSTSSQTNICKDATSYCVSNLVLPPPTQNLGELRNVVIDTTAPTFSVQYYSDSGLTNSLGSSPRLKAGNYYLKITANEALSGAPTINIIAEGSNNINDVHVTATSFQGSNSVFYITRTVNSDATVVGAGLENISITGTDLVSNTATNIDPTNESSGGAAYLDTVAPILNTFTSTTTNCTGQTAKCVFVSGIKYTYGQTAQINVTANYNEALSTTITSSFTARLNSSNLPSSDATVSASGVGSGTSKTLSGTYTVGATGTGQTATDLAVSAVTAQNVCDLAGNCLTATYSDLLASPPQNFTSNIKDTRDIQIDTTAPTLNSFTSTTSSGIYGAGSSIWVKASYDESLGTSTFGGTLNSGVTFAYNSRSGSTMTALYTVAAGQNYIGSNYLNVASFTQNACDLVGNCLVNATPTTSLPATNITTVTSPTDTSRQLQVDTTGPTFTTQSGTDYPTLVKSDTINVVVSDAGAGVNASTLLYGFSTNNNSCSSATYSAGNTFTSGSDFNIAGDHYGDYLCVKATDTALTTQSTSYYQVGQLMVDNSSPKFNVQYYSDSNLTSAITAGSKPILKEGTYYLKVTALNKINNNNEPLQSAPTFSITAEGTGVTPGEGEFSNDDSGTATSFQGSNSVYYITRTIRYRHEAVGSTPENIFISGIDSAGNDSGSVIPTNAGTAAAFTDTAKPTVMGVISQTGSSAGTVKAGTVNVTLTFNEDMNTSYHPSVVLTKLDSSNLTVTESSYTSRTWTGTATIQPNDTNGNILDANGTATLKVSAGRDLAVNSGNVMDDNTNVATTLIDTTPPAVSLQDGNGIDAGPTKSDTIGFVITDPDYPTKGVGVNTSKQYYGFDTDNDDSCGDETEFTLFSGNEITITGNHTNYLCIKVEDNLGNSSINRVGNKLNIDNTQPNIFSVTTDKDGDKTYKADTEAGPGGGPIDVHINFSEDMVLDIGQNNLGYVAVTLETGQYDAVCTFSSLDTTNSGHCDMTILPKYSTIANPYGDDYLRVKSVSLTNATLKDLAGNNAEGNEASLTINNNLQSKHIKIDMTAPSPTSFYSETADGTYGPYNEENPNVPPSGNINITATYTKSIKSGSSATVVLNNGVEVPLETINGTKLIGTYKVKTDQVITDQTISDLTVSYIKSQHVCDEADNCLDTSGSAESTGLDNITSNIANTSNINIDTDAPEISHISPVEGSQSKPTKITSVTSNSNISYTLSETVASGSIEVVKTGGTNADTTEHKKCTFNENSLSADSRYNPHNYFNTSMGCVEEGGIQLVAGNIYSFTFKAADAYGNEFLEEIGNINFVEDTENPIFVSCSVSDITYNSATINWTTDKDTDATLVYKSDSGINDITVKESGQTKQAHSITIDQLMPSTHYTFKMISAAAINSNLIVESNDSTECKDFYTISDVADTVAPIITEVKADPTAHGATITWKTNEESDSYVNYGETIDYNHKSYGNKDRVTEHRIVLPSDLKPQTTYHFQATSADKAGNVGVSADYQFTTLAGTVGDEDGSTAPTISNVNVAAGDEPNSMIITWETDKKANGMVNYGLDSSYGQAAADGLTIDPSINFSTAHSVTLNGLLSNTTYNFQAVSYSTGGVVALSGNDTFSTTTLDLASEPKVTNTNAKSAVIVWETVDPSFTGLQYGTSTSYGKTFQDAILANMHRVALTGLQSGQIYHFKIKGSKNSDLIYSKDYMFGTFLKPKISNFATSEIKDISAVVKWKVDVPSESYVEYQNDDDPEDKGTQGSAGLQTDNQVTLTGLKQGSKYTAKIKGVDVNKNDFESTEIKFETLIDTTPPEISQVSTDSSLVTGKEDKVQTIISWKTDEPATSQVVFDMSANGNGELTQKSKEDSNLTTNHLVVLANLKAGMVYHFKVISKDKNSNLKESQDFTLLTPQKKQSVIQMIIANFEQSFGFLKKLRN